MTVKDEGSSENEEDARDVSDKDQLLEKKDENSYPNPEDVESTNTVLPQPEPNSETKTGSVEETNEHDKVETKETDEETEEDGTDEPAAISIKRGPIRTYINKKRAANKNTPAVKTPASVKRETLARAAQASGKTNQPQTQEDNDGEDEEEEDEDEDDSSTSSSSSSSESEDGGYDPNALYCICRQKHNKRYIVLLLYIIAFILINQQ